MASTHNARNTVSAPVWRVPSQVIEIEIDFADYDLAQNETISLYDLPAGVVAKRAQLYVITAQATITDVDLGVSTDGSTNDDLLDGVSLAAASVYVGAEQTNEMYCNSASQLVITNKDAQTCSDAKIRVIVEISDLRTKMATQN